MIYHRIRTTAFFAVCFVFSSLITQAAFAQTLDSEQSAFLTLLNNYRAQTGAGPLQVSVALQNSSQWMSSDMATKNYFSHTDSLGRDPGTRLAAFGYKYFPWGENIAAGYSDAQSTLNQWATACDPDTSGNCTYAHRQNMLNPSYKVVGIGRANNNAATYRWYWTTDFGGVLDQTIGTNPNPVPSIASFTATPSSVTAGQSTNLAWNVTGATTITIDNGVGNVSTLTTKSVSPAVTTNYTLTATNSGGSSTAHVTLTVIAQAPKDSQAPTVPSLVSATARSSTAVDLVWTASSDNVGVTGYQVLRNGAVLGSVAGGTLSYTDATVGASSTYTYSIKAFDAAGNFSAASNGRQVTTPAPPITTFCPVPATNAFTGCYYANVTMTGNPAFVRTDNQLNFNWGSGSPDAKVPAKNFSARWQGNFSFDGGTYLFSVAASDGVRLYVDGRVYFNAWYNQPAGNPYKLVVGIPSGTHQITVEYYEQTGQAKMILGWTKF